jgi:hypothetical protein
LTIGQNNYTLGFYNSYRHDGITKQQARVSTQKKTQKRMVSNLETNLIYILVDNMRFSLPNLQPNFDDHTAAGVKI